MSEKQEKRKRREDWASYEREYKKWLERKPVGLLFWRRKKWKQQEPRQPKLPRGWR